MYVSSPSSSSQAISRSNKEQRKSKENINLVHSESTAYCRPAVAAWDGSWQRQEQAAAFYDLSEGFNYYYIKPSKTFFYVSALS